MSPTAAVVLATSALALAACGSNSHVAPDPAPPSVPAYDPASATATLLVRAATKGPLPRMRPIRFDAEPRCVEEQRGEVLDETIVATDGKLANVIAWVSRGADGWTFPPPEGDVLLEMKRCIYVPHVLTLRVGQTLRVSNPDHPMLHFHSISTFNGEVARDLAQGASLTMAFPSSETGVKFKCDVHGWMQASAGVFPHPFHGVTDREGTMSMKVPPADYEISAWHEYRKFAKPAPRTVTVAAGETKEVEFVFEVP